MNITNNSGIHMSFAIWLMSDNYDYDSRPNAISATKLLDSTRQIILNARASKLEQSAGVDLENFVPSSLGNAIHDSLEASWKYGYAKACKKLGYSQKLIDRIKINPEPADLKPDTIPIYLEQRSERGLGGYIITGKYDAIMDGQLVDYKSTGTYKYQKMTQEGKGGLTEKGYILQESIYRWLNQDKVTNDVGLIDFIFTDWSKLQSMIQAKKGYPQSRLITHKLQLMSIKDTEAFIKNKIAQVEQYMHSDECDIPVCTTEELWSGKTQWKYFKNPQGKRATKNFDNFPEAQTRLIKEGSVGIVKEVRGKVKRCEYCNAVGLCSQAKQLILAGALDMEMQNEILD